MKQYIILFIFTFCIQLWIVYSAEFRGNDLIYAGEVLTFSQDKNAYRLYSLAHPRSHVIGLVEQYSTDHRGIKTAFADNNIQNEVFRRMLIHPQTAAAIHQLNYARDPEERIKQDPYFTNIQLGYNNRNAPLVHNYQNGRQTGQPFRMRGATLVIAHRRGKQNQLSSTALVYTMFPNSTPRNRTRAARHN